MASLEIRDIADYCDHIVDAAMMETEFKKDKAGAKSNFTRSRNKLLLLVEEQAMPSRTGVRDACQKMDTCMEIAMEVLAKFSDFYIKNKQLKKSKIVVSEMEKIEDEFYTAYEKTQGYVESRKEDSSSVSMDRLSIDMQRTNNFDCSETNQKEESIPVHQRTSPKVSFFNPNSKSSPIKSGNSQTYYRANMRKENSLNDTFGRNMHEQNTDIKMITWLIFQYKQPTKDYHVHRMTTEPNMYSRGSSFEPETDTDQSIGQDLWRQLKRVQIPVFDGDKRKYQSWKAAFLACIDSAPATGEYKLLQLRQYLSGEALQVIENLGHSAAAYEAAKERLERKLGGKRRQIAIYLEELE